MFESKKSIDECYINKWTFECPNICLCPSIYITMLYLSIGLNRNWAILYNVKIGNLKRKNRDYKKVSKQDEDTGNLQILLHLGSLFWLHGIAFAIILFASFIPDILNSSSQNRDLKCNRICKLPVSSSYLATFYDSYSSFFNYQLFNVMVLGFSASGITAAAHTGFQSQLTQLFHSITF